MGESLFNILCGVAEGNLSEGFSKKVLAGVKDFIGLIREYQQKKDHLGVKQLIQEVMEKSGYIDELRQENTLESRVRIENLQEFLSVAVDFEANNEVCTLDEFLAGSR